jgi:hypothetical protein
MEPGCPEAITIIDQIAEALTAAGLHCCVERSKSKGWHIWVFFSEPVLAADVRVVLRTIALEAGARDSEDLVCPRSEQATELGNGTWLPLFGGDRKPHSRFFEQTESGQWHQATDQAAVLQRILANTSPPERLAAEAEKIRTGGQEAEARVPDDHPCAWVIEELAEAGVELGHSVIAHPDKVLFQCPLHEAPKPRRRGGSAAFFSDGGGCCKSAKCEARWGSPAQFLELLRGRKDEEEQDDKQTEESGTARFDTRPRILTVEEFYEDEPPEEIVEGLVYEQSTHLFTAPAKVGKTCASLQLAMCVATGEDFLGLATRQVSVLLISLELSAGVIRKRMQQIACDVGIPMPRIGEEMFIIAPTRKSLVLMNLLGREGRRDLQRRIADCEAKFTILDTLYRFHPGADPLDNAQMGVLFGQLNEDSQITGSGLWSVDHVAKGTTGRKYPPAQSALGAQVKGGASRVIAALSRQGSGDSALWKLDVESHFGSWEHPIFYRRPLLPNGAYGQGCVLIPEADAGPSRSKELSVDSLRQLFEKHGKREGDGPPAFESLRALRSALKAEGFARGNSGADQVIKIIERDYCFAAGKADSDVDPSRPISVRGASPKVYTWEATK